MLKLVPVETTYAGIKFRSRLEARWAVFFDAMGAPWRYEPETFDLDGKWYVPDFYLPQINQYLEIKPYGGLPVPIISVEMERPKAQFDDYMDKHTRRYQGGSDEFAKLPAACRILWSLVLVAGEPYIDFETERRFYEGFVWGDQSYMFCETECGVLGIEFDGRSERISCMHRGAVEVNCCKNRYGYDTPRLRRAYAKARGHRFWR